MNRSKTFSKITAWVLTLVMVLSIVPVSAMAEDYEDEPTLITGFDPEPYHQPNDPGATNIAVEFGTPEGDIPLPMTLMAAADGGGVFNYAVDVSSWECTQKMNESWQYVSGGYNPDKNGLYVFTPTLALKANESLAGGVVLPTIEVVVMPAVNPAPAPVALENYTLYFQASTDNGGAWGLYTANNGNAGTIYTGEGTTYSVDTTGTPTLILKNGFAFETSAPTALNMAQNTALVAENGTATITSTYDSGSSSSFGISAGVGVTISGNGTLNATSGNPMGGHSLGIYGTGGGTLTISGGGTVNAKGGTTTDTGYSYGIDASTLIISGSGTLTAEGGNPTDTGGSYGISAGTLNISGGTVTATGGTTGSGNSRGIYINGNITVSGGAVTATGGTTGSGNSRGIYASYITVSGGTVTATGGTTGSGNSFGIDAFGIPTLNNGVAVQGATTATGALGAVTWDGTDYTYKIGADIAVLVKFAAPPTEVIVAPGSITGATAGDKKITGLTAGHKYVIFAGGEWYSVLANGAVRNAAGTASAAEAAVYAVALSGVTEITSLVNGATYQVLEAVTLNTVTANGASNTTDTTALTLTFDRTVSGLVIGNISITANGGSATKGTAALTGTPPQYIVPISSVATQGTVNVIVTAPSGYVVLQATGFGVTVYKTAPPDDVTINLSSINPAGEAGKYTYNNGVITVPANYAGANNKVTITGNGTNGGTGYSIVIDAALNVVIANNTTIAGVAGQPALSVPAGATITGQGANISISGNSNNQNSFGIFSAGAVTIAGIVGNISATGNAGIGIHAAGNVNISGTTGAITSHNNAINTSGNVTISGTTGAITGSDGISAGGNVNISGTTSNISATGYGIYANNDVTISGRTGDISGGGYGIYTSGAVTISGTVGDISGAGVNCDGIDAGGDVTISGTTGNISATGGSGAGIYTNGNVNISGAVGDINGRGRGIYASGDVTISNTATVGDISATDTPSSGINAGGDVIITGKVSTISAGSGYVIEAVSYAVLDYSGSLLDIAKCDPAGFTVTFNYGTTTPTGAPVKAYISDGNKIPAFTVPATSGKTVSGWYKDAALTNSWNFNSDTVTADTTLYAKWTTVPSGGGNTGRGGSPSNQPSHNFAGGVNTHTRGSGANLVHTTQKSFSGFNNVRVNGKVLSRNKQYKAESGSTVITLYADYLDTLAIGSHRLEVYFNDGTVATAEFTVVERRAEGVAPYSVLKPTRAAGTKISVQASSNTLVLDGKETAFPAVNIDGYNYLKLRDIAALLNKTQKQFSISFNSGTNTISLNSGMEYNAVGGTERSQTVPYKSAIATTQKLVVDGKSASVSAYNIDGYNYFRLRDIAILLNFGVDFNGGTVTLDLATDYSE